MIYLPNHEHGTITWIKEKENTLYTRLFIHSYDLGTLSEPDIIIIQIPAHAPPLKIVECRSERPKKKDPRFHRKNILQKILYIPLIRSKKNDKIVLARKNRYTYNQISK